MTSRCVVQSVTPVSSGPIAKENVGSFQQDPISSDRKSLDLYASSPLEVVNSTKHPYRYEAFIGAKKVGCSEEIFRGSLLREVCTSLYILATKFDSLLNTYFFCIHHLSSPVGKMHLSRRSNRDQKFNVYNIFLLCFMGLGSMTYGYTASVIGTTSGKFQVNNRIACLRLLMKIARPTLIPGIL